MIKIKTVFKTGKKLLVAIRYCSILLDTCGYYVMQLDTVKKNRILYDTIRYS